MSRPDPIEYAERLYGAIRAANFSPMSFLAFGNAVKEGLAMRSMPRVAAEPFMRIVGEMLDLEEASSVDVIDADTDTPEGGSLSVTSAEQTDPPSVPPGQPVVAAKNDASVVPTSLAATTTPDRSPDGTDADRLKPEPATRRRSSEKRRSQ